MLLSQFFEDHYRPARLLTSKPLSIGNYRQAIRCLEKSAGRPLEVAELSDSVVAKLAEDCAARGCSRETATQYLRHLIPIWRLAVSLGRCPTPPTIRLPKPIVRCPRAWSPEEVGRILSEARREKGTVADLPACQFWPALLLTLYDSGARKNAVLNLGPADVSLEGRWLRLPADLQKGKREQICFLSTQTVEAVTAIWDPGRKYVFPWPYDRFPLATWRSFNRHFRQIVERAGVDASNGLCHRLRKTRATLGELVEPGSATADLGHRSRSLTVEHYIDPTFTRSSIVDRLPRPVEPGPMLRIAAT